MVQIMDGHGFLITRKPPLPGGTSCPLSSITPTSMPGNGSVQEPGLSGVAPGNGVRMCEPVSVCHQVSTTGQRSRPTWVKYHIHASGLMGSPTEPMMRRLVRSNFLGWCSSLDSDALMSERMAVGAV